MWPGFIALALLPEFLARGGLMVWVLFAAGAAAAAVFLERYYFYHKAQINTAEFLAGVGTVLRRDNPVEALAICDATPGPVPRLLRTAILARDRGREAVRAAVEETGRLETRQLEARLNFLATLAQIAPLLGLLGAVLGFIRLFREIQGGGAHAQLPQLAGGLGEALYATAAGLTLAILCSAAYNYLTSRVNKLVQDMEKSAGDITQLAVEGRAK